MAEPLFSLNNVSYTYPGNILALKDLNLTINKGDRVAIIGANGTGKSTMLTMLDALIFPTSGTAKFHDLELTEKKLNDPHNQSYFRTMVGFVFQNPDIQLFCPTVKEDILFGPLQLGVPKDEIIRRFDKVVELLKLSPLLNRSPHQLSLGEKKKVTIASVLIMEPQVLLLDEPTAGLDPQTIRDIIEVLYTAHKGGATVVMATHDLFIVDEVANTVHVFGKRTIIRSGTPEEILSDRLFLQDNNLTNIHIHRHHHKDHVQHHEHEHQH